MSRSIRKETSSFAFGMVGRFGGSSAGFVVATLNAASAASREVVVLRVLSAGILFLSLGLHFLKRRPDEVRLGPDPTEFAQPLDECGDPLAMDRCRGRTANGRHLGRLLRRSRPPRNEIASHDVRHGGLPPLCLLAADRPVRSISRRLSLPERGRLIGADLNRSESRLAMTRAHLASEG